MSSASGPSGHNINNQNMKALWDGFSKAGIAIINSQGPLTENLAKVNKIAKQLILDQVHAFVVTKNTRDKHIYSRRLSLILKSYDKISQVVSRSSGFMVKSQAVLLLQIMAQQINDRPQMANPKELVHLLTMLPAHVRDLINQQCTTKLGCSFNDAVARLAHNKDGLTDLLQEVCVKEIPKSKGLTIENRLAAYIEKIPQSRELTATQRAKQAEAKELIRQWGAIQKSVDPKSLDQMKDIIGKFEKDPLRAQNYTVANNKPLNIQDLKDKFVVKIIAFLLEGKIFSKKTPQEYLLKIKDSGIKKQAEHLIQASPLERKALQQSPQITKNPACNCFMGASLIELLDTPAKYKYITAALSKLTTNEHNPTIVGSAPSLIKACQEHPLDVDYTKWAINKDDEKKSTFLRMTIKDAAKCLLSLIEKRHKGFELNVDESNLLRLCFVKLSNTAYNPREPGKFPHIDWGLSILSTQQEDNQAFVGGFIDGLTELVPDLDQDNPFKGFALGVQYDRTQPPIGTDAQGAPIYPTKDVMQSQKTPTQINLIEKGNPPIFEPDMTMVERICQAKKPPNELNLFMANRSEGRVNLTPLSSFLDGKGYKLNSFVVRQAMSGQNSPYSQGSGHFIAYKNVEGVWLCYDDTIQPYVKVAKGDEIQAVLEGKKPGFTPSTFVFSKTNPQATSLIGSQRPISRFNEKMTQLIQNKNYVQVMKMIQKLPEGQLKIQAVGYLGLIRYQIDASRDFIVNMESLLEDNLKGEDMDLFNRLIALDNKALEKELLEQKINPEIQCLQDELVRILKEKNKKS